MEHYWGYNIGKNTPSKQNATCSSWPKMWPSYVNIFFRWTQYDDILHVKDRDIVKLFIVNSVKFVYGVAGVIYAYPCRVGEASDPHCLFSTPQRFLWYILCFGLCLFQGGGESFVQHLIVRHALLLDGKIMYLKPKCILKGIEILRNKHQVHFSDVKRVTMTWK